MKTIEEKAKAYDEALEKAKKLYEKGTITESLNYVFPELAESEDEKIRKELIEHIKANKWADYVLFQKFSPDDVIAWLEKQKSVEEIVERCKDSWYNEGKIAGMAEGLSDDEKYQQGWHDALEAIKEEKKIDGANKVEAKFKAGDWVVWENQYYKVNYNGCGYELIDQMGLRTSLEYGTVDENAHIWNIIKDAEDGDVLVYGDNPNDYHVEVIMIFKSLRNKHSAFTHFHIFDDEFRTDDWCDCGENAHPANKEQRDALMKAMADAGYTFDFEKKELKKLKKIEQSSAWSEEDEKNLKRAIWYVEHSAINVVKDTMLSEWLKSIKERVQPQPKQ